MNGALALNNPQVLSTGMTKTKETKKTVMRKIKNKLENAKLELVYTELDEAGIEYERKYTTVEELVRDLKGKVSELDYNKLMSKVKEIDESLNTLVSELDKKSTNAFTKIMTSDLAKNIAKSLGITLAGRTLLLLAPTVGSKALVGAGLAGYGLYRVIKNRKEIIKINESNELNNILMDLETTKEDGKFIETRFNEDQQQLIREYLKKIGVEFSDTGYLSLRQIIYSLDDNAKKGLCELLNNQFGKGIDIDKRIKSARKKLNVAASSITTASTGAILGTQIATAVNSIDPGAVAGVLNGTVLAEWIKSISGKKWLASLSGGLGLIGSEAAQHIPVLGSLFEKFFAAENLAAFTTIGATGGLIVGTGLGVASVIKKIHSNKMSIKEMEAFLKLDSEKYGESDKPELQEIQKNYHEPRNLAEGVIVDLVTGYLKDNNINYEGSPKTVEDLRIIINKLPSDQKKVANEIMRNIYSCLDKDPSFIEGLKKAGKISICLFTTGLAALSVYDIIKGGSFLPELSQKLFPTNNIYTPVAIPEDLDADLDLDLSNDVDIYNSGRKIFNGISEKGDDFLIEQTSEYERIHAATIMENNENWVDMYNGTAMENAGTTGVAIENITKGTIIERFLRWIGIPEPKGPIVADVSKIAEKLNELDSKELYDFYRYFGTLENDGTPLFAGIREVLGYDSLIKKAMKEITDAKNLQMFHNIVNKITPVAANTSIPVVGGVALAGSLQKRKNNGLVEKQIEEDVKKLNL